MGKEKRRMWRRGRLAGNMGMEAEEEGSLVKRGGRKMRFAQSAFASTTDEEADASNAAV